jgi:hypothetical protein
MVEETRVPDKTTNLWQVTDKQPTCGKSLTNYRYVKQWMKHINNI